MGEYLEWAKALLAIGVPIAVVFVWAVWLQRRGNRDRGEGGNRS